MTHFVGAQGLVQSFGKPMRFTVPTYATLPNGKWGVVSTTTVDHPYVSIHAWNKRDTSERASEANRRIERRRIHSTKPLSEGWQFTYLGRTYRIVSVDPYDDVAGVSMGQAEYVQP